jgi:TolB-like protein/tetratricopeptide (TPR) repeat protein
MSETGNKAVFLSYASQDAAAVERIAEALRAAGVEVWFDRNELVGGDAWDAKIRKQIAECALFVPVISAATQTRHEGYFRLEWRLAAQRTHMMSEKVAFLLPVVIDATRDADADVPGEFKAVQWTRLRQDYGGQARVGSADSLAAFGERVQALLRGGAVLPLARPTGAGVPPQPGSVAVLPFANMSADPENEYFAEGIADELLATLQKIPHLRVSARPSAWSFKGRSPTVQEVGNTLGVAHVVEGSVQRIGTRARIIVRLSRAATNEQLWSRSFGPQELVDVFATQSEIALAIVEEVRSRLAGEVTAETRAEIAAHVRAAQGGITRSPEAWQAYMRGRFFYAQTSAEGVERAIGHYEQAVAIDPAFATAWAAIARARLWQGSFVATDPRYYRAAEKAVAEALKWGPTLAAAHSAKSQLTQRHTFDWPRARAESARAVQLAPDDPEVLTDALCTGVIFGEWGRGLEAGRRAAALDPLNPEIRLYLAVSCFYSGALAEAEAEIRQVIALAPTAQWARLIGAQILLAQGRPEEALALARQEPGRMHQLEGVALATFALGRMAESDAALGALEAEFADHCPFQIAEVHAQRGDAAAAFRWLEHAWEVRESGVTLIRTAYTLRNLHGDPRWPDLLRRFGLASEEYPWPP